MNSPRTSSKRRPRGEGSLRRLDDGRWLFRLYVGGRRLQRTTSTQREALDALAELKRLAASGASVANYTVADALNEFLSHGQASRGWAPATVRAYASAIESHLKPGLGRQLLRDLTVSQVQYMLDRLLADGHSGRHVAHVRGVLRTAIAHAMRSELVGRNVAALAASPPVRRQEMRALGVEQLGMLFTALDGERLRPMFVTAATLGLRRGELIALRWTDVDLDTHTLTVRRTGSRIAGEYVEGQPKSARSRRTISLPASLVAQLRRQSTAIAEEKLRLGASWIDEDRVFPGQGGGPLGATTIAKTLDAALSRAGLPHVRVHDLRHSAATMLLTAGGSLRDVQEMLGHSSYSLTADVYAHILDEQRQATAERIDQALGAAILTA